MLLWPFNHYPGTDYETYNWDWLLGLGKKIEAWAKDIMEYLTRAETAADDAETAAARAEAAKNAILSRYYTTPQAYGAVGDGVTDDTAAIQEMFDDTDAPVYFPEGDYLITSGVTDPETNRPIYMDGSIIYNGPATALAITGKYNQFIVINVQSTNPDYIPNSIGCNVKNSNNCTIILKRAKNFETGVVFEGNNAGFAYNKIWVMLVLNNLHGIIAKAAGTGWINENQWYGGRYTVESGHSWNGTATGITLNGSTAHPANDNTFYNPSTESIGYGIRFINAVYNTVNNMRAEHVSEPFTEENSYYNSVDIAFDSNASYNSGVNIINNLPQSTIDKGLVNTFTTGSLIGKVANNDNYAAAQGLTSFDDGQPVEYLYNCKTGANKGLELAAGRAAGVILIVNSTALYHVACKTTAKCRYGFILYDSNNEIIDVKPLTTSYIGGVLNLQKINSGAVANGWVTGSDINAQGLYIKFPENTVKVAIIAYAANVTELMEITVRSNDPGMISVTHAHMPLYGSAPNSQGTYGQMVTDRNGNTFLYDGTSWDTITVS